MVFVKCITCVAVKNPLSFYFRHLILITNVNQSDIFIRIIMKHHKTFTLIIALILSFTHTSHGNYSHPELNGVREHIKKNFIARSTPEIIKLIADEKALENKFQQYLEEDPMMKKIEEIATDGTSGASLSVITFSEDVKKDFDNKGKHLTKEFEKAVIRKNASILIGALGFGGFILGVGAGNPALVATGAGFTGLGGVGYYVYGNEVNTLPKHIKTVHTMEEKWNGRVIIRTHKSLN